MNDKDWKEEFEKWDNLPVDQILSPEAYINWLKLNDPHIDFIIDEFCRSAWQAALVFARQESSISNSETIAKLNQENKKLLEVVENKEHETICWIIEKLRKLEKGDKSKWSHSRNLDFAPVELSDYLLIEWKRAREALKEVGEE
jgi:hypothetical protein